MRLTLASAVLVLSLGACSRFGEVLDDDEAPNATSSKPDNPAPKAEQAAAVVNGQIIPMARFDHELRLLLSRYERARHEVKPPLQERLKDSVIRRLVDDVLLAQKAEQLGVEVSVEDMDRQYATHKRRYGSEEALRAHLERLGSSESDLRRNFEITLLRQALTGKLAESVSVSGQEIRDFYDQNLSRYQSEDMVRASQILIRVPANADASELKERATLARKVRSLAARKGADFASLAREYGEDPSRDQGGDLGFFAKGRMVKAVETAVWKLPVGRVVRRPIKTQLGFHILKKTGFQKASTQSFESVSPKIEQGLLAQKRAKAIQEALEAWRQNSKIEIFVGGDAKKIDAAYRRKSDAKPPFAEESQAKDVAQ